MSIIGTIHNNGSGRHVALKDGSVVQDNHVISSSTKETAHPWELVEYDAKELGKLWSLRVPGSNLFIGIQGEASQLPNHLDLRLARFLWKTEPRDISNHKGPIIFSTLNGEFSWTEGDDRGSIVVKPTDASSEAQKWVFNSPH
ncbi:hypothetical protein BOTBODRAFT_52462 [Botryobasidium botryosum FD-172 SS1]|uniref:Ricin B lectin domain-containing protein n=1 Tax=Botryobasidium botryosum (strain FD-172 SS1) TaxID=930990 RepID=A0A067MRT2_BOTB1|nr:hypothetical protein BOTBODRAFT_52462 [Botryobasidium botryosum FD-172 SS1]